MWHFILIPPLWNVIIPSPIAIEPSKLRKTIKGKGTVLLLYNIQAIFAPTSPKQQMEEMLFKYKDVFEEPRELPPIWSHDHKIPLLEGTKPVSVKPSRYPYFQKTKKEIERMVREMLDSSLIQPRQSPFSSPMLLVQKQDGSWHFCVDYRALN